MNFIKIPFFLAVRSIKRSNKWTLVLIFSLIAVAFINLVLTTSLLSGIIDMGNNQIINTYTGHITLTPKSDKNVLEDKKEILKKIRNSKNVVSASAQVFVPTTIEHENIKINAPVFAIDPIEEKQVTTISTKMISGAYLDQDDENEIILGRDLAGGEGTNSSNGSFKGVNAGDKVTLKFNGKDYEFTIKGIFYAKFISTDRIAFIPQETWRKINPMAAGNVTNVINVRLNSADNVDEVIADFKLQGIEANFDKWEESLSFMKSINSTFDKIRIIFALIGAFIAAITIFIVVYIDTSSRRRQFGILRALGIKPLYLRISYILQAFFYSVVGIIFGSAVFIYGFIPYFDKHPISLPLGDSSLVINPDEYLFRVALVLVVTLVSGFIPSYFITKTKILDAISGK